MTEPFSLQRRYIVFTGRLASMDRGQATRLVTDRGGHVRHRVSRRTDALVIGSDGWPLRGNGQLTNNLRRAEQLRRHGHSIHVLPEDLFLQRLQITDDQPAIHRRYTLEQLSRMAGISGLRLRRWIAAGLLRPVSERQGVALFDFAEVAATRTFCKALQRGCCRRLLLHSLQRLQRWLPQDARAAEHLRMLRGTLVVRTDDGCLIDGDGQLRFAFENGDATAPPLLAWRQRPALADPDAALDAAWQCQQQGDQDAAIEAYEQWLECFGSEPQVLFNLANLLTEKGQPAAAIVHYRQALKLATGDSCCWNNLGLALAACGQTSDAIDALRRAIRLNPDYADPYYNLADLLDEAGQPWQARLLWRHYLRLQADGPWSDYARRKLAEPPY